MQYVPASSHPSGTPAHAAQRRLQRTTALPLARRRDLPEMRDN